MKNYDAVSIIGTAVCILAIAFAFVWNVKHPAPRPVPPPPVAADENGFGLISNARVAKSTCPTCGKERRASRLSSVPTLSCTFRSGNDRRIN